MFYEQVKWAAKSGFLLLRVAKGSEDLDSENSLPSRTPGISRGMINSSVSRFQRKDQNWLENSELSRYYCE